MSQLRIWRQHQGLSQADLGRLVGVTDNAISQFERGVIKPRVPVCESLARALNVPFSDLFQEFYGVSVAETRRVAH